MWRAFCETLKDCGRNGGGIFMVAVLSSPLVVGLVNLCFYNPLTLGVGLLGIMFFLLNLHERRKTPSADIAKLPPLSRADWQIARSKLVKDRNK